MMIVDHLGTVAAKDHPLEGCLCLSERGKKLCVGKVNDSPSDSESEDWLSESDKVSSVSFSSRFLASSSELTTAPILWSLS